MKFLTIRRDDRFSPNSIDNDRLILQAVADRLSKEYGISIPMVDEANLLSEDIDADCYISMGRLPETLDYLSGKEHSGKKVLNSAQGVKNCQRSFLDKLMRDNGIAMPPVKGNNGYWLKRGDAAAQSKDDVVFCQDEEKLNAAKEKFLQRGVSDMVVSTHVVGDLIKFYGVGDDFFRCYYPSDDKISKFGDEKINGMAHHYPFDKEAFHKEAARLSKLTGVDVFGGDAIVDSEGKYYIIDFNDWPSFFRCREDAADAIAQFIIHNL